MRHDQKDYQMLAEAYTTVQEREQLDEVLGFGTGGIGDKLVSKAGMLAPNKAGKAGARIQTQQFVKQHIMPVFSQLTQQLGDDDPVDAGQVMDIIGNAYGVDPDQIKTFSKFQPGQTVKVKDARNMLFPAAGEAAGIKATYRYAANSGAAGGYTPMQGGGQPVAGGGQIKNPRGSGVAPTDGETKVQSGSENPSVLKKIGSGVGNLIGGFAGGVTGGAKKSFDYVNNMGKEDLAKSNSGNSGKSDQQQQQQGDQQQQQQGDQERADPKDLPPLDDLLKGNPSDVIEPEVIDNSDDSSGDENTQSLGVPGDGDVTKKASVDMQQNPPPPPAPTPPGQIDQKGEITPTVITPPAPKSEEEEEENQNQLKLPLKEYSTPLGGVGFMSKRWGKF